MEGRSFLRFLQIHCHMLTMKGILAGEKQSLDFLPKHKVDRDIFSIFTALGILIVTIIQDYLYSDSDMIEGYWYDSFFFSAKISFRLPKMEAWPRPCTVGFFCRSLYREVFFISPVNGGLVCSKSWLDGQNAAASRLSSKFFSSSPIPSTRYLFFAVISTWDFDRKSLVWKRW